MKKIVFESDVSLASFAADMVQKQIESKPDSILGLATGSTPLGLYKELIDRNLDFSKITAFNLDEYYPLSADNDQSYHYFIQENLFSKINVKPENIHILDGETENPEQECVDFDKKIDAAGGIDLQILGIGRNGHIGFNEPDDSLIAGTHVTELTESTIEANARFFEKKEDVPTKALTMGIASILKAKTILLMANGKDKHEAISQLLTEKINTQFPATMLKVHPNVVLICDREAYGNVD